MVCPESRLPRRGLTSVRSHAWWFNQRQPRGETDTHASPIQIRDKSQAGEILRNREPVIRCLTVDTEVGEQGKRQFRRRSVRDDVAIRARKELLTPRRPRSGRELKTRGQRSTDAGICAIGYQRLRKADHIRCSPHVPG